MDYHIHKGQEAILTEKLRDKNDRVIVTEKLDGSNVAVARKNGSVFALTRAGYEASTSPYPMHHAFADWVRLRDWSNLPDGFRVSGEWMHTAHGTMYAPTDLLICFDAFGQDNRRLPHDEARAMFSALGLCGAHVISDGPPVSVDRALSILGEVGFHGATEQIEGAVWRCERRGVFDFMAKFVRHEKVDGKYLDSVTGKEPVVMARIEDATGGAVPARGWVA